MRLAKEKEGMDGNSFERYCKALRDAVKLREKLAVEKQHAEVLGNMALYFMLNLPDPDKNPLVIRARKEEAALLKTIKMTVHNH